jgi:hypothetical protein
MRHPAPGRTRTVDGRTLRHLLTLLFLLMLPSVPGFWSGPTLEGQAPVPEEDRLEGEWEGERDVPPVPPGRPGT